jgi:RNA polymerase sigma factor (sigma-70 family)
VRPFVGKLTLPPTETPIDGPGWSYAHGSNLGRVGASPDRGPRTRNGATLPAATLQASAPPRRAHATDEQLARAAGRGDVRAFEALYERFEPQLLSFARHMLGRAHDAEDVVQHTFLAADTAFRSGKVPQAVRAWLYTVARNRCVSILRSRREDGALPDDGVPSTENLAAAVEQREDLRRLLADLRRLPEQQRAALLLAELGDLSHPEVAQVIGVRPGKVKALVFQAREALMAAAHARSIPCRSIQEELATATGAALRRQHLRNHLAQCPGCREYADRVRAQRASLALILPVIPSVALRESVFSGLAGGTTAAGAGAGFGVLAVKATTAKLLTIAAVGGAAAGGGTLAVTADDSRERPRAAERRAERARSAPSPAVVPAAAPSARPASTAASQEERSLARTDRRAANGSRDVSRRSRRDSGAAERPARAGHRPASKTAPPGQAKKEQGRIPPGQAKKEHGRTPPGQAKKAPAATPKQDKPKPAPATRGGPKPRPDKPPRPAAARPAASARPDVPAAAAPPGQAVEESKAAAHKAPADQPSGDR